MKSLVPYTVVSSFAVIAVGVYVGWPIALIGLGALLLSYASGVYVLGSDDREFKSIIAQLELQASKNQNALKSMIEKSDQAHAKVSEALSALHRETSGRWGG